MYQLNLSVLHLYFHAWYFTSFFWKIILSNDICNFPLSQTLNFNTLEFPLCISSGFFFTRIVCKVSICSWLMIDRMYNHISGLMPVVRQVKCICVISFLISQGFLFVGHSRMVKQLESVWKSERYNATSSFQFVEL